MTFNRKSNALTIILKPNMVNNLEEQTYSLALYYDKYDTLKINKQLY